MKMNSNVYDVLKWIAQIALPALATLWFAIAKVWNLPFGVEILGTVSAVDVFLGAILGISSVQFYKRGIDE